ncbi:hypothetical protein PLICRDRAFT_122223 [Plicaturopsis crispa FD-325 SS-3]|nr:hypothetical protein PLICRDRAFT_122223 [Plicaturopsis crispa FD-325 SS-3]
MSSREPMWYCHECHAEMRPLMVPDPHCASCNGTFVEKLENPSDDPREYHQHAHDGDFDTDNYPPGMDNFLLNLHALMGQGRTPSEGRSRSPSAGGAVPAAGRGIRIDVAGPNTASRRTWVLRGPNTLGRGPRQGSGSGESTSSTNQDEVPMTMSDFLRRGPHGRGDNEITGPMMMQYLLALMGNRPFGATGDPFAGMFGLPTSGDAEGPGGGRWGDYVFGQEALDQIITQLMENSNTTRPVPATEEIMSNLPREVLESGSPLLERDCAVCKEQFKLDSEDPDEQVVVTLPCKHPFHEGCIIPWLKSSGTCPVCRHALIPQPEHHGPGSSGASGGAGSGAPRPPGSGPAPPNAGGLLGALFGMGGASSAGGSGTSAPAPPGGGQSNSRSGESGRDDEHIPGGWSEELD